MIRGPAGRLGIDAVEPQLGQIERIDEHIDHANRIALVNPVIEAFRQQRRLPAIRPLNEALHPIPPQIAAESYSANQIISAFSHSQGHKQTLHCNTKVLSDLRGKMNDGEGLFDTGQRDAFHYRVEGLLLRSAEVR